MLMILSLMQESVCAASLVVERSRGSQKIDNNLLTLKNVVLDFQKEKKRSRVVFSVMNSSSAAIWVPKSYVKMNAVSYESLNWRFSNKAGGSGVHQDGGICVFPQSYRRLLPKEEVAYSLRVPDAMVDELKRGSGGLRVSIWTPWRDEEGILVGEAEIDKALQGDALIRRIELKDLTVQVRH